MSRYVDEIISSIRKDPKSWLPGVLGNDIRKKINQDDIRITGYGNSATLSIIHVFINGADTPTRWIDRYKLEKAVGWWFRNVDLKQITG